MAGSFVTLSSTDSPSQKSVTPLRLTVGILGTGLTVTLIVFVDVAEHNEVFVTSYK